VTGGEKQESDGPLDSRQSMMIGNAEWPGDRAGRSPGENRLVKGFGDKAKSKCRPENAAYRRRR